jgi:hypothetical protein
MTLEVTIFLIYLWTYESVQISFKNTFLAILEPKTAIKSVCGGGVKEHSDDLGSDTTLSNLSRSSRNRVSIPRNHVIADQWNKSQRKIAINAVSLFGHATDSFCCHSFCIGNRVYGVPESQNFSCEGTPPSRSPPTRFGLRPQWISQRLILREIGLHVWQYCGYLKEISDAYFHRNMRPVPEEWGYVSKIEKTNTSQASNWYLDHPFWIIISKIMSFWRSSCTTPIVLWK